MPARGPVGGARLGWLGRWGGVRGVADFFESFQCRKPGRGGVEAAAGGAAPGDWSTRWSSSTSTRVPGCSWGLGGSASCSRAPPAVRFNTAALYQSEPEKVQP